tara:strand:+ start:74 stop:1453 length:1380 start_codon:yes stop_codon:yes gene_type:complete
MRPIRYFFLLYIIFISSSSYINAQGRQSAANRIKIDGVSAVVGDYVILDSDIDKMLIEMESQGFSTQEVTRCQLLGKLMEDKLYAHHAIQDSLETNESEIYNRVDQVIENFTQQLGSLEKVLEYYNKDDEAALRQEIFKINEVQQLSSLMQNKIVEGVEITPEEVRQFFQAIPALERPVFGTELEISQIVVEPEVTKKERDRIINQLKLFREDVLERGLSFASKAILYSQDPGSRASGGKYTLHRKKPRMVKEFRDIAFALQEGEISEPFKTDFGWHIIQLNKIRGQEIDVRHILLTPRIEVSQLQEVKKKLDSLRVRIMNDEISFKDAAYQFSDEKETRFNGGVLINPASGDTKFELTNLDPVLYSQIRNLKDLEISAPLLEEQQSGLSKYKILMVSNRFEEHIADYSKDYPKIKDLALKEKQLKSITEWMKDKIDETYVNVNKDKRSCSFENNWLKN